MGALTLSVPMQLVTRTQIIVNRKPVSQQSTANVRGSFRGARATDAFDAGLIARERGVASLPPSVTPAPGDQLIINGAEWEIVSDPIPQYDLRTSRVRFQDVYVARGTR